jgi:transcriptional regulator with XRE-family HTH domain
MPELTPFGRRLREVRLLRELNQQELADKSGVPMMMISHFETGTRPSASAATLRKLADALDVSIDYLLARSSEMTPSSGPMYALFRTFNEVASERTMEDAAAMLEALLARDRQRGKGSSGDKED